MDIVKKSTVICGLRGSGKSTLAHHLNQQLGERALIYDTQHEFPHNAVYNIYRPQHRYSIDELCDLIMLFTVHRDPKMRRIISITIDEANRFAPGGGRALDSRLIDLNDSLRHPPYEIGVIWIVRRPTQLHPDIIGLADNLIVFQMSGKNDIVYLNNLKSGMGDMVQKLSPYHAIKLSGNELTHLTPIVLDDTWKKHQDKA